MSSPRKTSTQSCEGQTRGFSLRAAWWMRSAMLSSLGDELCYAGAIFCER
jgi:hypothetical protein